jgi:hypothetical protein
LKAGLAHGELTRLVLDELRARKTASVVTIAAALRLDSSIVGNTLAQLARAKRIRKVGKVTIGGVSANLWALPKVLSSDRQ